MLESFLTVLMLSSFLICGIFQICRMMKTKSSNDVSLWFVGLITFGVFCGCGLMILTGASNYLLVPQTIDLVLSALVFGYTIYYRKD